MKKYLKILVIIFFSFFLVSCFNNKDKDEVIFENNIYKFNQDEEEFGIKYKVASNLKKTILSNSINYSKEYISDELYFAIRLLYYKDISIDDAIDFVTPLYDDKYDANINNIDYTALHSVDNENADVNIYYHKHNEDVYIFEFTSSFDISKLIKIFLSNVNYN